MKFRQTRTIEGEAKERDRDMTGQRHTDHRSGQDVSQRMNGGLKGSRVRQQ